MGGAPPCPLGAMPSRRGPSLRLLAVGWVTLPPLFLAIRILSPLRAFCAGAIWGAALFAFALLLGVPSVPVTFTAGLLLSLTPAVYSGIGALVTRGTGWPSS